MFFNMDKLNELEASNEILRKENESLKEERDELQGKLSPFFAPNENQENFTSEFELLLTSSKEENILG